MRVSLYVQPWQADDDSPDDFDGIGVYSLHPEFGGNEVGFRVTHFVDLFQVHDGRLTAGVSDSP